MASSSSGAIEIKRFDVVTDDSHYHYQKKGTKNGFTDPSSRVHKKIMQEWKILDQHLPDSIYVRAYENRIDLLRAAIVGAAGTPYHDGLFFFDIAFPPNYPTQPPKVYYHSHGLGLNPNLYSNGFVCLSLLNTWHGQEEEKWSPSKSTVLQVLVSIQGLVLNEHPYYNEPGLGVPSDKSLHAGQSKDYSDNAFALSCRNMLYTLRNPPKNFEGLVSKHFRERASVILLACTEYANGRVRVGYYRDGGSPSSTTSSSSMSNNDEAWKEFVASMERIYPQLLVEFKKSGASLGDFAEELNMEKKTESLKRKRATPEKTGSMEAPKVSNKKKEKTASLKAPKPQVSEKKVDKKTVSLKAPKLQGSEKKAEKKTVSLKAPKSKVSEKKVEKKTVSLKAPKSEVSEKKVEKKTVSLKAPKSKVSEKKVEKKTVSLKAPQSKVSEKKKLKDKIVEKIKICFRA